MRLLRVSLGLAWRNLMLVRRMPSVFIPSLLMPLFLLLATAGGFRGIAALPSFDGASYIAFTLPMAVIMGGGFAGVNAGMTLARDIEGGFADRLIASPSPRLALIVGPAIAAVARTTFTTTVLLIAAALWGVMPPGVIGTAVVYLMAAAFGLAAACWAMGVALRARTVQATPLMQVVMFMAVFFSVAYAPREVQEGWLRTVADWNPVTYILEAAREAELASVTMGGLGPGLLAAAGVIGLALLFALGGLRRLAR